MAYRVLARRSKVVSDHFIGRHVLALRNMDRARSTNILGTFTNYRDEKDKFIDVSPPKEDLGISALKIFRSSCYKEKLDNLKERFSSKMEEVKLMNAALRINARLLGKISGGTSLSSRERIQLLRTTADIFTIVPLATRMVLPVLNCALPLLLKLFPNMLSTSTIRKMREHVLFLVISMSIN
ncbi:hypothetical protein POM88_047961 [Heracleum sosnowskyi]|uniref:Letm1 RBD domain-containing protein n=1 Tax=Heracleum sosnowskyi TaxID=360622 RepID=A0AAD8LY08_9APIA|nr:hypothetical protein POM88_047961 [Heracleum sosnowskyi]